MASSGTVTRVSLEGGFWGIVAEDGTKLYPVNLSEDFQQDGLRIAFQQEPAAVFTMHQWGSPVTLSNVRKR